MAKCLFQDCEVALDSSNGLFQWQTLCIDFGGNDNRADFQCCKCDHQFEDTENVFSCPNSLKKETHPMPFVLCESCAQWLEKMQSILSQATLEDLLPDETTEEALNEPIEENRVYSKYQEFGLLCMDPTSPLNQIKRCMVLGSTGVGKSTLLNKIAGCYYAFVNEDGEDITQENGEPVLLKGTELFDRGYGEQMQGVTKLTSFSKVNYLDAENRPLIILDTPGSADPSIEEAHLHEVDLNTKLRRAGQLSTIVVVLNNTVLTNMRLDDKILTELRSVAQMFAGNGFDDEKSNDFWDHVVIVISQCDEGESRWRRGKDHKIETFRRNLRDLLDTEATLPVLTMSAVQDLHEHVQSSEWSHADNFERLWEYIENMEPMITTNVQARRELRTIVADQERQDNIFVARRSVVHLAKKIIYKSLVLANRDHDQKMEKANRVTEDPLSGVVRGVGDIFVTAGKASKWVYNKSVSSVDESANRGVKIAAVAVGGAAAIITFPLGGVLGGIPTGLYRTCEGLCNWPTRIAYGTKASQVHQKHLKERGRLGTFDEIAMTQEKEIDDEAERKRAELNNQMKELIGVDVFD